ncbi:malate dehydrogenase [uncultured Rothia sp.]|uniref:malate dehydrogenase n=1 Tax=uncultured Rothia sp. TaxID=316088 RepID=UPI0032163F08
MSKNSVLLPTATVTLTGAAGQIGYASLFRIASGALLGPHVRIRLNLLEVPAALKALEGTAMELTDCSFDLLETVNTFSDPVQAFDGADVALLVGARPRSKGMERADLLEANGAIFSEQGQALNEGASENVRVVVVGNPANTNALIAASHAPDIPLERFTALTRLDHNRAVAQLAQATDTHPRDIEGVAIWGNHSASQFPSLEYATVEGRPALEALAEKGLEQQWLEEEFIPRVAQRGAEIIQVRGGSSVGSAAHAAIEHINLWNGSDGNATVSTSMAVPTTGAYGVEKGLICSFPITCQGGEYAIDESQQLSAFARQRFEASVDELRQEKEAVSQLGLLGSRLDW